MSILTFSAFLCSMCICLCCVISSIISGVWGWEAKKISDVGLCEDETLEKFILCPLNENILDGEHQDRMKKKYDEGKLGMSDILNSYYIDGVTNTKFVYCDEKLTKCTLDMVASGHRYELIEDIVYIGSYEKSGKKRTYVYFPYNIITGILLGDKIETVDEFIQIMKGFNKDFRPNKYRNVMPDDRKKYALDTLFVEFPYDGVGTTFKETIYARLPAQVTAEYFDMIRKKINNKEVLTTFEFFSYFAILGKSTDNIYKVLIG